MYSKFLKVVATMSVLCMYGNAVAFQPRDILTVPIGNAGNAADPSTGFGAVSYEYRMGLHEVTNDDYAAFLNAKAPTDPLGLWNLDMGAFVFGGIFRSSSGGRFHYTTSSNHGFRGGHPVTNIPFINAMRFVNWLHNGQGDGDTETGAYTITEQGLLNNSITRNPGARYALPTEDEWYKAAYHQPRSQGGDDDDYWLYPTSSNLIPTEADASISSTLSIPNTCAGFAPNFYGTHDMGGNVWEWSETILNSTDRIIRGGSFASGPLGLQSTVRLSYPWHGWDRDLGFRVVELPAPSALSVIACMSVFASRRRRLHPH